MIENTFSWIQRVNTEEINPQFLPSISLLRRSELPKVSCIYFVLTKDGQVSYIGRTNNLKNRWRIHHVLDRFKEDTEVKIAWLEVSDCSLLPEIEAALINWFRPPFNRAIVLNLPSQVKTKGKMQIRMVEYLEVEGLGEKIKHAREVDRRSLSEICRQIPMTNMNWYKIEAEETKALPIETLRRIEEVLGINFGVKFDN